MSLADEHAEAWQAEGMPPRTAEAMVKGIRTLESEHAAMLGLLREHAEGSLRSSQTRAFLAEYDKRAATPTEKPQVYIPTVPPADGEGER